MAAAKLKRRRGAKKKGSSHALKLLILAAVLIVMGVMFTLLGGLREALDRQALRHGQTLEQLDPNANGLLVHGQMNSALTRPNGVGPGGSQKEAQMRRNHDMSLIEQAQERQRRIQEDHEQHLRDRVMVAAGGAAHDVISEEKLEHHEHLRHPSQQQQQQQIPEAKMPPPGQLGGPYPYPLDPPPANYNIHESYTPLGGFRFAEYAAGDAPYQITDDIRQKSDALARVRRDYVKQMMQTAWKGYVEHAFGMDEIKPASGTGDNSWGGFGVTLVDTLDTLWLCGMKDEFWQARDWVRDHLNHAKGHTVSVFETTIRSLGGLLAAYDWSGDKVFLDSALDLGKRLAQAFNGSPTGLPFGQVNLGNGHAANINWARGNVILSELGSIQIEFRMLDQCLKTPETAEMRRKTEHVYEVMNKIAPPNALYPYYLSNGDASGLPRFTNDHLTFGAMADSFYEYMLKMWIQGGKVEPLYREMYDKSMQGMHDELIQRSEPSGLLYIADKIGASRYDHKMDHLVCFMGGLLALGAYTDPLGLDSPRAQRDLKSGRALTYTCYQMYARMNTGISAEFVQFRKGEDFRIGSGAPHYLLRPETVESFFILSQLTGDPVYREWGWEVFQSIEKYCRTGVGYGTLSTVQNVDGKPRDKMETFFLAETVKYMYLLQDPDTEVDVLHKHVFNTEAHPMRVFNVLDPEAFKR